ncbi:MAG: PAS domain S-box protein [Saprospiraceae bacterium]|nr:PAS domain S-box protein [Saprospiraceae bacterium]
MKREGLLIWLAVVFAWPSALLAQDGIFIRTTPLADSLLAELDTSRQVLERYELHFWLAEELMSIDANACLGHTREAIKLCRQLGDEFYLGYLLNCEANCYDDLGQYQRAIDKYEEAIEVTYHTMLDKQGDSLSILQCDLAAYYNNLGYSYFNLGQYNRAFEYYLRSLDLGLEHTCPDLATAYGSVAELFFAVGDVQRARDFISKAQAVDLGPDAEEPLMEISIIGDIYLAEGKLDSAEMFYESMLDTTRYWITNYDRVIAYRGLAEVGIQRDDREMAITNAEKCYQTAAYLDNKIYQASALRQMGEAQLLGGNQAGAREHLLESIRIAETTRSIGELHQGYDLLSEFFVQDQDYQQAFEYRMKAGVIQDSLRARDRANFLALTMLNRELQAREKETSALARQLTREQDLVRNSVSFGIAMLLFGCAVALIVFLMMRFRGRGEDLTRAFIAGERSEDRGAFMKRICLAVGLMLLPVLMHAVTWQDYEQVPFLVGAIAFLGAVYLLVHVGRLTIALLLMMIVGYASTAMVPLYAGPLRSIVLTIASVFVVVAYSTTDRRLQFVNVGLAVVAFVTYHRLLPSAVPFTNANPEGLELMVGLLSIGSIFVALYFFHNQLNRYRLDLQQANKFLRRIANMNPHFIYAMDTDRRFTFVNKAMIDEFGQTFEGMRGKRAEELLPVYASDPHFAADDTEVLTTGEEKFIDEEMIIAHNGEVKWLESIKKPIRDDNDEIIGLLGVATDITARRQSQLDLQSSLSMLAATLDSTADGILVVDTDNNIVQYNQKMLEMWRLSPSILAMGDTYAIEVAAQQLVNPADFVDRVADIYRNPEVDTFDTLQFKDGRVFERYSKAQKIGEEVVGRVWSFRDVTEKTRASIELKASEEKYRYIFENADEGILLYDLDRDRPVDCNQKCIEVFGCQSAEELMMHPLSDFANPLQQEVPYAVFAAERMHELLDKGKSRFDLSGRKLNGDPFIGQITAIRYFTGGRRYAWYFISDVTEAHHSRISLERSEARYRMILEDNLFPIFTVRHGRLRNANEAFRRMTGYETDELRQLDLSVLVHPDDLEDYRAFAARLQTGERSRGNINARYVRKDGSVGYLIASVKANYDTDGTYLESIITAAEITQLKNTEFALAESEERYRVLFDQYPIGIMVVDTEQDMRGIACNSKLAELLESTEETITGNHLMLFSPEIQPNGRPSAEMLAAQMEAYRLSREPIRFEWQFKKENGETFLADVIYSPVRFQGQFLTMVLVQDITVLKEAERKLRQSESRYRSLVEASPDGIVTTDVNGNLTFASRRMLEIMGMEDERALIGRNIVDFALPEERDRAREDLGKVLTSGTPVFSRYWLQTRNNTRIPVELGAELITDSQHQTMGVICLVRDISEQYAAERTLRESEQRYRLLFENTFDGFVILNGRGVIEECNNSAVDLMSYPDMHLLKGKPFTDLFPRLHDLPEYQDMLSGQLTKTQSLRMTGTDFFGIDVFVEVSFCQVPVDKEYKIACAIRNVAEKVILEQQEREIEKQQHEMDALNREIASHTLFNSQKNRLLSEIKEEISAVVDMGQGPLRQALAKVERKIDANLNESDDIVAFRLQFEKIHPNFFKRLLDRCSTLTNNDLKYCAYIRLNMTTQDICNLLYIERKSVEMAKYRIKKKLGLGKGERLNEFIHQV